MSIYTLDFEIPLREIEEKIDAMKSTGIKVPNQHIKISRIFYKNSKPVSKSLFGFIGYEC